MTLKQSYGYLHRILDARLSAFSFGREGEGHYSRLVSDGVSHHARFPARRTSDGAVLFTLCLSARFDALERLLRPEEPGTTVMVPIHLLQPERHYYEWPARSPDDYAAIAGNIVADFRQWALPFFSAHRDLDALRQHLSIWPPRYAYTFGPVEAACLLAAVDHLLGDTAAVLERLKKLAAEGRGLASKRWLPYKQLHDTISEASEST